MFDQGPQVPSTRAKNPVIGCILHANDQIQDRKTAEVVRRLRDSSGLTIYILDKVMSRKNKANIVERFQ